MPVFKRNNGQAITGPITLVVDDVLRLKLSGVPKNAATVNHFTIKADVASAVEISQKPNERQLEQVITLKAKNTAALVHVKTYHVDGKAADCIDSAKCVPMLQIKVVDKIVLPDETTDAGALARLLLAETPNPSHPDYTNSDDAARAMQYMRIVIENRLTAAQTNPTLRRYVASGPSTLDFRGIITAKQHGIQFDGFSSYPNIGADQTSTIEACIKVANTGSDLRFETFRRHVEDALAIATGSDLRDKVSTPATLYYWRTAGRSSPTPHAKLQITLGGQDFYSLSDAYLKNPNNP